MIEYATASLHRFMAAGLFIACKTFCLQPNIADAARQAAQSAEKSKDTPRRSSHGGQIKKSNTPATMRKKSEQYAANITKRGYAAAEKVGSAEEYAAV